MKGIVDEEWLVNIIYHSKLPQLWDFYGLTIYMILYKKNISTDFISTFWSRIQKKKLPAIVSLDLNILV